MKQQFDALIAEIYKNKHSKIIAVTFIAISLAPLFGGVFMYLMKGNGAEGLSGAFKSKAQLMSFSANWNSYLGLLSQAVGVGGVLIFGFIASWLFGRDYSEGTVNDLLALPVSRIKILNARFIYYIAWSIAVAVWNIVFGLLLGFILQIPGWSSEVFSYNVGIYSVTTILVIILNAPVAFLAIVGKGYLVPLGLVALTLVLAQIIGALGYGQYFPWAVPGIYSGSGGADLKNKLNILSYIFLFIISFAGYSAALLWWKYSDQ